jgi:hypothetical protein
MIPDPVDEWTLDTALAAFRERTEFNLPADLAISYLALHFVELPQSILSSLTVYEFESLLSNRSLLIISEDWLYEVISSRFSQNKEFFELLRFVEFEFLSVDSIKKFATATVTFYEHLSFEIWTAMSKRFTVLPPVSIEQRPGRPRIVCAVAPQTSIEFKHNSELDGAFAWLRKKYGKDLLISGIVGVTANHSKNPVLYLLDLDLNWVSAEAADPWICIDLEKRRITLTHYSLRSSNRRGPNHGHPREWVVEVKADGSDWIEVDRRGPNEDLNGMKLTGTYALANPILCRFVRLRLTGTNHAGGPSLLLNAIELFGKLLEPIASTPS